jgi:hypothetical protein
LATYTTRVFDTNCVHHASLTRAAHPRTHAPTHPHMTGTAGDRAPFSAVKHLVTALRGVGDKVRLHELMVGSEVVVDAPKAATPNPELIAR